MHSLGGVQLALFAHKGRMLHRIDYVSVADVACGVGNVFHNKGAIGAFCNVKTKGGDEKRILFVSSHLAAHASNVEDRNADFWRIVDELEAQVPPRFLLGTKQKMDATTATTTACQQSLLLEAMDYVFWGGDLNYRLDLPREYAEHAVRNILKHDDKYSNPNSDDIFVDSKSKRTSKRTSNDANKATTKALYLDLLRHDQLLKTIASGKAFHNFSEGPITFPPTFKYDTGSNVYDSSHKKRVPSWTDRILFKCDCDVDDDLVKVMEYGCVMEARQSDHRPVFAKFSVRLASAVQ